jgi:hypothetical protein
MDVLNELSTKKNRPNQSEYVCEKCGMNFGSSLGDMELHKTIVHLQNGDISSD